MRGPARQGVEAGWSVPAPLPLLSIIPQASCMSGTSSSRFPSALGSGCCYHWCEIDDIESEAVRNQYQSGDLTHTTLGALCCSWDSGINVCLHLLRGHEDTVSGRERGLRSAQAQMGKQAEDGTQEGAFVKERREDTAIRQ